MARKRQKSADRRKAATVRRQASPSGTAGPRVELRLPSPEEPFLRRYVPPDSDVEALLGESDVLDWRRASPTQQVGDVSDVANRIICADAGSALRRLPDRAVACIITSPPYWNFVDYGLDAQIGAGPYEDYLVELLGVWRECERVLLPNGKLCINTPILPIPKAVMPEQHTRHLKNLNNDIEATILRELSLQRFSLYVWQKQTTEKMFGSYPYPPNIFEQNTIEFINVFVKPGKPRVLPAAVKEASRLTEQQWLNLTRQVWHIYPEDVRRARHPAPFPEALANRLIAMYTFGAARTEGGGFPGDIVLDPFNGTGAACVAAKRLGRRYIGIDLSPDFSVAAAERLRRAKRDDRIFLCRTDRPSKRSADEDSGAK
jgi:DNA modification methylase